MKLTKYCSSMEAEGSLLKTVSLPAENNEIHYEKCKCENKEKKADKHSHTLRSKELTTTITFEVLQQRKNGKQPPHLNHIRKDREWNGYKDDLPTEDGLRSHVHPQTLTGSLEGAEIVQRKKKHSEIGATVIDDGGAAAPHTPHCT